MKRIIKKITLLIPIANNFYNLRRACPQVSFASYLKYLIYKKDPYWFVHKSSTLANPKCIYVGKNSLIGARPRCYIQGIGGIYFGNYIQLGPNVAIMSGNHGLYDQRVADLKSVIIDDYCWLGTASVILPGVILGKRTIVAAGAIVTKSFKEGYCIIGGNPAKVIKELDKTLFHEYEEDSQYYGFIAKNKFEKEDKKKRFMNTYKILEKYCADKEYLKEFYTKKV